MADSKFIAPLDGRDCDICDVGGKAINLSKMIGAGFSVPPAIAVTSAAYDRFLEVTGLRKTISDKLKEIDYSDPKSLLDKTSEIREAVMGESMPEEIESAICEFILVMGSGYFAVRSSAVAEDLANASFAGQQDTFLNVRKREISKSIQKCWASYWNDRAVKYRHDAGIDHMAQGIAVVVQKMVESEISGVMFTADPITGSDDIVIESSWGLGESIASGIVTPDRYVCGRDGALKEEEVRTKDKGYFLIDGCNTLVDIDGEKANVRCAGDEVLGDAVKQGIALEKYFGCPQDVEWAFEKGKVYILQSRAVTTLADKTERDGILWSRAYGDEYWADPTTPLFYTTMGKMLVEIVNHEGARMMGYKDLVDGPLIKLHKSRVYFCANVLERVFAHYPKFIRSKELLNYFPVKDHGRILSAPNDWYHAVMSQVGVFFKDRDGLMTRTDKAYKAWAEGFLKFCKERIDSIDLESLSDKDLDALYWDFEKAFIKHYRLIRYGMVSHSIMTNLMIKSWLKKWAGDDDGKMYAALVSGLPGNKTAATNMGIAELGKVIMDNPDIGEKIDSMEADEFLQWMDCNENVLKPEFDRFLEEFGHRSNTREIMAPRWKENRGYVLGVARQMSMNYVDLKALEEARRKDREEVLKQVCAIIRNPFKRKLFKVVLKIAQTYLTFRENQRFYLDHILFRQRLMFLEIGRRFEARGLLKSHGDVFFLEEAEVFDMLNGRNAGPGDDVINARKDEFYRYGPMLPPKFLKDGIDFDDPDESKGDMKSLSGAASSPGSCTGTVKVIVDIERLSEICDGDILVTSNTDPGWTAVFSRLGGLITETGGILCHGAVISREYRIPAVTAVKDATRILKTGQKVIVDGSNGTIHILEEEE